MRTNDVRQIYEDEDGYIWFATGSGMTRWDGQSIRNYYLPEGLSYPSTRCVARNPGGGFLIGTDGGLESRPAQSVRRRSRLRRTQAGKNLGDSGRSGQGTLWLGTRGSRLIRMRNGRITRYTNREGLLSNAIFQILDDGKGKLWLSSPAGVSAVLRQELNAPDAKPRDLTRGPVRHHRRHAHQRDERKHAARRVPGRRPASYGSRA